MRGLIGGHLGSESRPGLVLTDVSTPQPELIHGHDSRTNVACEGNICILLSSSHHPTSGQAEDRLCAGGPLSRA